MSIDFLWAFFIVVVAVGILTRKIISCVPEEKPFFLVLVAGFMVRVGVAALVNLTNLIPEKYYMDSVTYQKLAVNLLKGDDLLSYAPAIKNYAWLLSRVYYLFGAAPLTAHVLICIVGVWVLRNIYRTTELIANRQAAIIVALIWAFMPSYVFVTSQTFRDPIIFFVISTIIYWMVKVEFGSGRFVYLRCAGIFAMFVILCKIRPHQMDIMLTSFGLMGVASFGILRVDNPVSRRGVRILGFVSILVLFFNVGQCSLGYRMLLEGKLDIFSMLNEVRGLSANPKIHWAQKNLNNAVKTRDRLKNEIVSIENVAAKEKAALKESVAAKEEVALKESVAAKEEVALKENVAAKKKTALKENVAAKEEVALKENVAAKEEVALKENVAAKEEVATKNQKIKGLKKEIEIAESIVRVYTVELNKMQKTALGPGGVKSTEMGLSLRHDNSLWEFLYRTPVRMFVVLFSPFPWQTHSNFLKIAVLENMIFVVFFVSGVIYILINRRKMKNISWFLPVYLFICLLVYSVTEGNVGTAYRHRMQYLWLFYAPGALYVSDVISCWRAGKT